MTQPLVIVGAGGHARACVDVIETTGQFTIVAAIGLDAEAGGTLLGYPIVGASAAESVWTTASAGVVAVGQITSPEIRMRLFAEVCARGCLTPTIVSPRAHVSRHATVGPGTVVLHGAVVNAAARVGANGIVNSLALIEHDAQVGDHCHVSTGAVLNSGVQVGEGTFIGSGAHVKQGVRIGARCVIGMGQIVRHDLPDGTWLPRVLGTRR